MGQLRRQSLSDLGRIDTQPLVGRLERWLLVERITCFLFRQLSILMSLERNIAYMRGKGLFPSHGLFRVVGNLDELDDVTIARAVA